MYGALGGFFFILTIYLQTTLHYSSLAAGLASLPVTFCMILLSERFGLLASKYGPRWFMTAGPIAAGIGILLLWPLHAGSTYLANILPGIVLFGLGMSITVAPLTTTVLAAVRPTDAGIASGVNNAVSRFSGLLVVAILGLLGAGNAYRFAVVLCGCLAVAAGLLSAVLINNPKTQKQ
jgi:MFS family permease